MAKDMAGFLWGAPLLTRIIHGKSMNNDDN